MAKKITAVLAVIAFYAAVAAVVFRGAAGSVSVMKSAELPDGSVRLPVIMYHSILKDRARSGKYVITPDTLDKDIKYLHEKGCTTVSAAQVIDFAENGTPLPDKPVMLTFDDGCTNNLFYAVPILKDNNARGIFAVVGAYTDEYTASGDTNPNYGYMRWEDVYELYVSENCEVANHSYDFHKSAGGRRGALRKPGESDAVYRKVFEEDTRRMQEACKRSCGFYPVVYAYPYGLYSEESVEILRELGFKMTFSCEEGINTVTRDRRCLELMKRYNRPAGPGAAEFFEDIISRY
ncbi:MAG TPA: polysaccharide deacetylase family protein [Candidatus Ornithomonoglobus intestinigallinarum]|uniref:Polysaccharide deacetylase family protein n=1 Tax=Candidatus Ornithomonoglobus intestinigallinarum TaxID=2840894 RepID=A0A9D1H429_9FIRM|nr:polysaccharide deacetylase family protein [Candidatus Ornithomonoglobus intestinigallinarum]